MPIYEYECARCARVSSHVVMESRNVGLWAKKRAQQMDVDLGEQFESTVETARTGKLVKEMI
jgi:hypothetical protein